MNCLLFAMFLWSSLGAEAIWKPDDATVLDIRKRCAVSNGPSFQDCFISGMKRAGASSQAVAFMRDSNGAYLRDFRRVGPVDIAYVTYPFRANENDGIFLVNVNGTPPTIDIDNQRLLPQAELAKDPTYAVLAKKYPRISLWPGDRYQTGDPVTKDLPQGGRRFLFSYRLRNFCHACAVVGSAQFGFDFDQTGKFIGTKLIQVAAS